LGECECGAFTKWWDSSLETHVCSTECYENMWRCYLSSNPDNTYGKRVAMYSQEMAVEKDVVARHWESDHYAQIYFKDILIVVKDQIGYLIKCIESIQKYTSNYNLYIWDNESDAPTREYLEGLRKHGVRLIRSEANKGFIGPNNVLASLGNSDYIIVLNSDTIVKSGWATLLCGVLEDNPSVGQVGYLGGLLNSDGTGSYTNFGYDVDYILGWCFAMRREDYKSYGLFDEELKFAYFEDADLSLRLKNNGLSLYSCYLPLVHHYGNKTLGSIDIDLKPTIMSNLDVFRRRWHDYLSSGRVKAPRKPRIWGSPGVSRKSTQA